MILTFDGDIKDVWDHFYIYYEELGCYFQITHGSMADYSVKFPANDGKGLLGYEEHILRTEISIFTNRKTEKDYWEVVNDAIKQITDIGQRNLLPQHSNVQSDLIDLIFNEGVMIKVKE